MCPLCGHTLSPLELVPIFSYLALRGRCRWCRAPISPRYMLVELLGGALAVVSALNFDFTPAALLNFVFLCLLTTISFIDIDTLTIPDGLVIAIAVLGVAAAFVSPETSILSRVIGVFCVSLPMFLLTLIIPSAFGGGDIKLMAACGLFLGWKLNLLTLFFGILAGGVYGIWLLASKRKGKKDRFAFGPFLCFGAALSLFFGTPILSAYLSLFSS